MTNMINVIKKTSGLQAMTTLFTEMKLPVSTGEEEPLTPQPVRTIPLG
jgi:hypothetical protein